MKKSLLLLSLILVIAVSIISGTLAMYTTTIDNLAVGSVVAKEFILLEDDTDTFETNVKIAPTEEKAWSFAVKNYNGALVSETDMDLLFTVDVKNTTGKTAIAPLVITVTDSEGEIVGTAITGTGITTFTNEFKADTAESQTYTVTVFWPSNNSIDYNFAGANFGTTVSVSVTGTQK